MPAHSRLKNGVASLAYVAGIHVFWQKESRSRGWPGERAFTPVFGGLCRAMTKRKKT